MNYPKTIPTQLLSQIFKEIIFRLPEKKGSKRICLSFDDGPHPEGTPRLLEILRKHNCKSLFFMLGKNIDSHTEIVSQVINEGHEIGFHGYEHLNGWRSPFESYIQNVTISHKSITTAYFRPPFGRLSPSQYYELKKNHKLVYWSKMPGDFDPKQSDSQFKKSLLSCKNRDIVALHDWAMLKGNRLKILEESIIQLKENDFNFVNQLT